MRSSMFYAVCVISVLWMNENAKSRDTGFLNKTPQEWAKELTSKDAPTRRAAAFALGKCGALAIRQLPELIRLLTDADESVREAAAFAVAEMGQLAATDAIGPLSKMVRGDASPIARRGAAFALGKMGAAAADVADVLKEALEDTDPRVRQNAAWALGQLKSAKAVDALAQALHHADALVRRDAAIALGTIGKAAKPAVPDLASILADDDNVVRQSAAVALAEIGPDAEKAIPDLVKLLQDKAIDDDVQLAALTALSKIGGKGLAAAMPFLRKALASPDVPIRQLASLALREIGRDARVAVVELADALAKDSDAEVRRNAGAALAHITFSARELPPGDELKILNEVAAKALPALIKALRDEEADVRKQAADALAQLQSAAEPALPQMMDALENDPDPVVRKYLTTAFQAFDLKRNEPARRLLIKTALKDLDKEFKRPVEERVVNYQAAVSLATRLEKEGAEVVPALIQLLKDPEVVKREGTAGTASGTGAEGGAGGTSLRETGSGDGRVFAADALGLIGPRAGKEAKQALIDASKDPMSPALREAAKKALEKF